ncbi:cell surface protein [Methanosarcina siciliae C2J]|uniref:Cell surface protein n=2 Tax=Methanosarcina siciliae TaxID=38027 RepID=A0A0E3LD33_9EURY|nr:cell surface protein [Methanosarcina siciliae C2J]
MNEGHDVCSYYVEDNYGEAAVGTTTFATTGLSGITSATLTADYLASNNGNYGFPTADNTFSYTGGTPPVEGTFTNLELDRVPDVQGAYSGVDSWDVTASVTGTDDTTFAYSRYFSGTGTAAFYKIPLAFLVVKSPLPAVAPVAGFSADVTTGTAPLTVTFTDESTNDPTEWAWDFGDGGTNDQQNPVHEYTAAGTYTVTLAATNSAGSDDEVKTDYVTVTAGGNTTGLADAPWPKFQYDLANTGQSPYNGPQTNTVLWTSSVGGMNYAGQAIAEDGTIYTGGGSTFYALYPNGTTRWSYGVGNSIYSTPAIAEDGTIYVGCMDSKVYAFNADGTLKWSYTTGNKLQNSPAIGADGTVYIGSYDKVFYAINPDGSLKWTYDGATGYYYYSSAAIADDGTIYVGDYKGVLHALYPNGTARWTSQIGMIFASPIIGEDGTIYLTHGSYLSAVNPDGTVDWSYTVGGYGYGSPAVGSDGTVYVGSYAGEVFAINANGTQKWSYPLSSSSRFYAAPAIGADGSVYLGSTDSNVYAFNTDGTLKWSYTTDGAIRNGPTIGDDGTLYIGNQAGTLYAFKDPEVTTQIDLTISGVVNTVPGSAAFAREPNAVRVMNVKNQGTDTATNISVAVYADDVSSTVPVATTIIESIAAGATTTVTLTDPTIRDLAGGTVTYSAVVDPDDLIVETDEVNNNKTSSAKSVVYNGYKGKGIYWEGGSNITTKHTFDLNGNVVYYTQPDSFYRSVDWTDRTETWTAADLPVPSGATIEKAFLYISYNWDQTPAGVPDMNAVFNGNNLTLGTPYMDWSNFGAYAYYEYGLYPAIDVTSLFNNGGDNTLVMTSNTGNREALYPSTLVVIYSDPAETRKQIFINEECDELAVSASSYGTTLEEATAYAEFSGMTIDTSNVQSATLHSFAGSAGPNEGNLIFNGVTVATGAWQGTADTASAQSFDVKYYLEATGNEAGIQATTSGGMDALQQILVVEYAAGTASVAGFTADPTSGDAPLNVTFTDASIGEITSYAWDFETDGTVDSYDQNPSHEYTDAGTYTVTLTVTGPGGSDDETRTDYITVTDGSGPGPVGLADTAWPKYQCDTRNTGQSSVNGPQTNNVLWTAAIGGYIYGSEAIGADGTIYVGSATGNLYALNPDGTVKWSFTTGGAIYGTPAISADGTIYFGSRDNRIYALNPDGTVKWSYTTGYMVDSSPTIGSDGTIYIGSLDCKLYALNPDGTVKWTYDTNYKIGSVAPAIGADGTIYVADDWGSFYALNPDGTLKWSYDLGRRTYRAAIGADSTIYLVGQSDGTMYALNADGTLKWSYKAGVRLFWSPAIASDGTIYVGSTWGGNKLFAINPDGTLKWSYTTGGGGVQRSAAIGADGTVYFGSSDGNAYALNPNGTLKWKYATGEIVSTPSIGSDGTLYIGNNQGIVYAFKDVAPVANFSADVTSGDAPLNVTFTDQSTGSPTSWSWDFGDGETSDEQNPTHIYSTPETNYTVTLTVENALGNDTETKIDYIRVGVVTPAPVADFTAEVTSGDVPLRVQFTDLSTAATGWAWDFDNDGTVDSTAQNPVHTYGDAGIYSVNLTVINAGGSNSEVKIDYITVSSTPTEPEPVAAFTADVTDGTAPLTVNFTDQSAGTPTSWLWDFGDGANSTAQNPVHAYSAAGNYTVNLTVENAAGSDFELKSDYIKVSEISGSTVTLYFDPASSSVSENESTEINLVASNFPAGLSGYNLTVVIDDPDVAEIVDIEYPTWALITENSTLPGTSIYMKTVDLEDSVQEGAADVVLATLTVSGKEKGSANLSIGVKRLEEDSGDSIEPALLAGTIEVTLLSPLPDQEYAPKDLDGDGLYEDLTGNGEFSFVDIVAYFHNMDWIEENMQVEYFDFNGNGRIDFDDVVRMFAMI